MPRLSALNKTSDISKIKKRKIFSRLSILSFLSIFLLGGWFHITGVFARLSSSIQTGFERQMICYDLTLSKVFVEGRNRTTSKEILSTIGIYPGEPFSKLNLEQAWKSLKKLPWIQGVVIERRWPNQLYISIQEKKPLALWQHNQKIKLIDNRGQEIESSDIKEFKNYPFITGEGAPVAIASFLKILPTINALKPYIIAFIRVGKRRWNIKMQNGLTIMLPEDNMDKALVLLNQLHEKNDITHVAKKTLDLRLPQKVVYE